MPEHPGQVPVAPGLPGALAARLHALRPVLEVQGVLQHRVEPGRAPAWRIRYRVEEPGTDGRRHRSLQLGTDQVVAEATWRLVTDWREQRAAAAAAQAAAQAATCAQRRQAAAEHRFLRQCAVLTVRGGRDLQRKAARDFDQAVAAGPRAAWMFSLTLPYRYQARPRGRPKKAAFW